MQKADRTIFLLLVVVGAAVAQVQKPKPVPYTAKILREYTAYCALWRTDATFRSTIRLKNSLDTAPIDATVTLYMADGTPYVLPAIHLAKAAVDTVEVNAALAQAPETVQSHLSRFGSASVKYRYDWQGVVLASMSILDTARSLEYMPSFTWPEVLATVAKGAPPPQSYEALWWRYGDSSAGFVALANATEASVGVEVSVSGLQEPAGTSLVLGPHATVMLDLKTFFAGDPGRVGGLHIAYNGVRGAIQVVGGLEDATKGFSVDLPVTLRIPPIAPAGPQQMASVGVMVNEQDPLLNFPGGVTFTPYAYFRNISDTPKTLHFAVYYMDGRAVKSLALPDMALQPGEAQQLPVADLLKKQTQIQDINFSFSYDGYWGDVLAGIGSTDQSGNYVFPVVPGTAYKGGRRTSHYWLASGGFDTMYTVWNPEPEAQELLVTLKYGTNGESYKLPVTLEAHASTMIDIGELIRTRQLDQDGKVLPQDVKQGSLLVGSPTDELEDAVNVVVGMGIYNPTKATCGSGWLYCDGFVSPHMDPSTFSLTVGDTQQLQLGYWDNHGWEYDVSGSQWTSTNTAVITVNSSGLATGAGSGGAGVSAYDASAVPVYAQIWWQGCQPPCPTTNFGDSASGTVKPKISGPSTVWWFGGASQSGYATEITLTSSAGSGTTWSVTAGDNKVNLSTTSGAETRVTSSGSHFSSSVGDVTVVATANDVPSDPFSITTRKPYRLASPESQHECDQYYGYSNYISYEIQDQLLAKVPSNVSWNEKFTSSCQQDNSQGNWCTYGLPTELGDTGTILIDHITGPGVNNNPAPNPTPVCSGNSTKQQHWSQELRVGSLTSGTGVRVQTDTLVRFADHAEHQTVVSPAP